MSAAAGTRPYTAALPAVIAEIVHDERGRLYGDVMARVEDDS